jgi:hypothetical protein
LQSRDISRLSRSKKTDADLGPSARSSGAGHVSARRASDDGRAVRWHRKR